MTQAQPFYFGPVQRPLFGWLHLSDSGHAGDLGLLICPPLGYDAISSHRTLRHLAEAAATRGVPALRFDYDGTGDSAGADTDPGRVHAWLDSIRTAAATLREHAGVRRVCIFGIRLGASLALLAALGDPEITLSVLINPVVEGRRYLRELRALAATSAIATTGNNTDNNIQEAAGFITTAETRQSLSQIQLASDGLQAAPSRVLLLERADLPLDDSLASRLSQVGSSVTRRPFPGYSDMLRDAHETVVPQAMIQEALDWMQSTAAGTSTPSKQPLLAFCEMDWSTGSLAGRLRERIVRPDATGRVFGIVTEPIASNLSTGTQTRSPVLLLLNSGAVHHIGPNRLYVQIARQLALHGVKVMRLDIPGLGDSPVEPGQKENDVYPELPLAAVAQAVDYARTQLGASDIHSAGICSGAYHSFKAAVAGLPLQSIVVINPLTFFWKPEMALTPPAFQDTAEVLRYQRTGLSATSLRKFFTGQVDLLNLTGILGRYGLRRARNMTRHLVRSLGVKLEDDLVAELRKVRAQTTRIHFVFANLDPGYSLLQEQAGAEVQRLARVGAVTIDFITDANHTFTPHASQQALLSRLSELVAAQPSAVR